MYSLSKENTENIQSKMSDIPFARLEPMKPPFNSKGIDSFGPITIKQHRPKLKQWETPFLSKNFENVIKIKDIEIEKLEKIKINYDKEIKELEEELEKSYKNVNEKKRIQQINDTE